MKKLTYVDSKQQEMLRESREHFLQTLLRLQKIPPQEWAPPPLPTTQQPCALRARAPASPAARALRVSLSDDAFCWLLSSTPPPATSAARHDLARELAVAEGVLFDLAAHLATLYRQHLQQLTALNDALDQRDNRQRALLVQIGPLVASVLRCQRALHAPDQPLAEPQPVSMAA